MKKYNLINNTLGWLCFVISAVTYLLTLEPTASFWDCPEFIAQGAKLEVGHPPGNPIFMLTARFFVTVFGGNITDAAVAVNSMSALLSAATILLLFWTITHLVRKIVVRDDADEISLPQMILIMGAGLCGALAYTWSDTFWFSAVEGEVYAFSSFCTALVFWLILKWENRADEPYSDRYLVLIAYVIGISIAVHLLNLLCIPAIVLVFYYRKYKSVSAKGSLIALGVSFVLVALILYGLVPGFVKVAQGFELFFVNTCGLSFNVGVLIYALVLLAVFIFTIWQLYRPDRGQQLLLRAGVLGVLMLSGLTFITDSVIVWVLLFIAAAIYLFGFCRVIPKRIFSISILSIFVIFIGYSSYALLLIRASANTPMNQNAPDNVFNLSSYLNREQYGKNPLIYGPVFAEQLAEEQYDAGDGRIVTLVHIDEDGYPVVIAAETIMRDAEGYAVDNGDTKYTKAVKTSPDEPDRYVREAYTPDYATSPDVNMIFTRMYSTVPEHVQGYKDWSGYRNTDIESLPAIVPGKMSEWADQGYAFSYELPKFEHLKPIRTRINSNEKDSQVWTPSFLDNLRYFFNYQLNHMYWRYFMWNFAGRQNDLQGNGEPHLGNWISGIPLIDNPRLGDQSLLPDEYGKGNKGHNVFYLLPLIMGLIGLLWQSLSNHKNNPERGIQQFWVVFFLFFMTGVAIVLYLNQTPGQPRERDYAFAGSFYAFAIWIGMGVPALSYYISQLLGMSKSKKQKAEDAGTEDKTANQLAPAVVAAVIGIIVPLQMVSQTWDDHDRSHRYTTRDFGENYLNSLDPNAIIFTNGDNDTFPLWYAQEVEGVRTDVRVVNLSYLATDWYANQLLHPYYDAAAVKITAEPKDYAYDRLAYSFSRPASDTVVNAIDGLKRFYDSDVVNYGKSAIKIMDMPRMYSPVDTAVVYEVFGIKDNLTDSLTRIPYISDIVMDGFNGGGFALNKLLSYDILANSIADGYQRPVYIASTVPDSYNLGLGDYLYTTGMARQFTPFKKAVTSPVVEKAYENIISKYRWGGLDDVRYNKGLYLDETVRRMVSSVRNSMIETAESLQTMGDLPASEFAVAWAKQNGQAVPKTRNDMARNMLYLMEDKLPSYVTPFDVSTELALIELYFKLYAADNNPEDLERAQAIIDNGLDRYGQLVRYVLSLDAVQAANMGYMYQVARYHLPLFIAYKNAAEMLGVLGKNPGSNRDAINELVNNTDSSMRVLIYPFLYLTGKNSDQMLDFARTSKYSSADFVIGAQIAAMHDKTGVDQMKVTKEVLDKYGLTTGDVLNFNPYVR